MAEGKAQIKDLSPELPKAKRKTGPSDLGWVSDKGGLLVSRPGHNLFFVTWVGICVARS